VQKTEEEKNTPVSEERDSSSPSAYGGKGIDLGIKLETEHDKGGEGKKRALIVSIGSYKHLQSLEFCLNDGKAVHEKH
jgi:hypothetical protein